jgi:hypothetical protein
VACPPHRPGLLLSTTPPLLDQLKAVLQGDGGYHRIGFADGLTGADSE